MELACALIVALAGLVVGTPSGYGVKGGAGAVAKAEANSAAFTGVGPLPPGATVAGSYTKSSASNSASSASSAYSSSFSFSGSGITPGAGLPSDIINCKSGSCPNGNEGPTGSRYSGTTGNTGPHSGANAISTAGSASFAGSAGSSKVGNTLCSNGDCQGSHDCQGANCDNNNDSKCTSSDCGSGSAHGSNVHDTDDIAVNTAGSAAKSTSSDQTKNSGLECLNGNCAGRKPLNDNNVPNSYSSAAVEPANKPSVYISTPKQSPSCSSPDCDSTKEDIYDKNRPSSYNVPILAPGTPLEPTSHANCASGNCPDYPSSKTATSIGFPSVPNASVPPLPASSCTSPNCADSPGPKYPSQTRPIQPSYNYASANAGSGLNPTSASFNEPKTNVAFVPLAPTKKSLPYTGGFGGPPGILKPNDFSGPSKISSNYYKPNSPVQPYRPSPCSDGNCGAEPKPVSPLHDTHASPIAEQFKPSTPGSYNPSACASGNCQQSFPQYEPYKPVQYNPSHNPFCASGNCGISKNPSPYTPNSPGGSQEPKVPTGPKNPAPCTTGTCGSYPEQPSYPYGSSNSPTKIQNIPAYSSVCSNGNCAQKPSYSSPQVPPYSPQYEPVAPASFGGPSGILKPNDYSTPSHAPSSYGPAKPTGPAPVSYNPETTSCSTGNCGSQATQSKPQYNPLPSYKPTPTTPAVSGSSGAAAVSTAIDYSAPYSVPISQPSGSYNTNKPQCSNGLCGSQPQQYNPPPVYNPTAPSSGFSAPGGISKPDSSAPSPPTPKPTSSYKPSSAPCLTGICGSQLPESSPQYNPSSVYKPTSQSSGFGGPAGVLKPDDYNAPPHVTSPSNPVDHSAASPCSTGNCGSPISKPGQSSPSSLVPGFGGPAGVLKPNDYNTPSNAPSSNPLVETYNPPPCSNGNCGSQLEQSPHQYYPLPTYKPTAPTSGFHGPAGILKPNDFSVSPGLPISKPTASYYPSSPCATGTCGSHSGQSAPQYNPSHNPTTPNSGFGGPAGVLNPNDYKVPSIAPPSYKPTGSVGSYNPPCSSGSCGPLQPQLTQPQHNQSPAQGTGFGGPAGILRPNDYSAPFNTQTSNLKPTGQAGPYSPGLCSSGSCSQSPSESSIASSGSTSSYHPTSCTSGNCGSQSQPNHNTHSTVAGAYSGAGAIASAKAIAYTGGFGGPPGLLKPYDGKVGSEASAFGKVFGALTGKHDDSGGYYGKSFEGTGANSATGSGAQGGAIAGASAGAYNGAASGQGGPNSKGCSGGCGNESGALAGAAAKSVATAGAGAYGGSFASSSASAHASAGAATKGGYGR